MCECVTKVREGVQKCEKFQICMTSFMDCPDALFDNQLLKTGGQNFGPALRIAELLLIGRHDGCHINCLLKMSANGSK